MDAQSVGFAQALAASQAGQAPPPQSTSVSMPFVIPSMQPGVGFRRGASHAVAMSPGGVVAADFDGDGRLDLAATGGASGEVTVLRRAP